MNNINFIYGSSENLYKENKLNEKIVNGSIGLAQFEDDNGSLVINLNDTLYNVLPPSGEFGAPLLGKGEHKSPQYGVLNTHFGGTGLDTNAIIPNALYYYTCDANGNIDPQMRCMGFIDDYTVDLYFLDGGYPEYGVGLRSYSVETPHLVLSSASYDGFKYDGWCPGIFIDYYGDDSFMVDLPPQSGTIQVFDGSEIKTTTTTTEKTVSITGISDESWYSINPINSFYYYMKTEQNSEDSRYYGIGELFLGNSSSPSIFETSQNRRGILRLYSTGPKYEQILTRDNLSSNSKFYLPACEEGYGVWVAEKDTIVGDTHIPVYVNAQGEIVPCVLDHIFSDFYSEPGGTGEEDVGDTQSLHLSISNITKSVSLDAASDTQSGVVTTGDQTFKGEKTFNNIIHADNILPKLSTSTAGYDLGSDALPWRDAYVKDLHIICAHDTKGAGYDGGSFTTQYDQSISFNTKPKPTTLTLGNEKNNAFAQRNRYGLIDIYDQGTKKSTIRTRLENSDNFIYYLPNATLGAVGIPIHDQTVDATGKEVSSLTFEDVGSPEIPVYVKDTGEIAACTPASVFSNFSSLPKSGTNNTLRDSTGEMLSLTIAGETKTLALQVASDTSSGVVTTIEQTFKGDKTFIDDIYSDNIRPNDSVSYELGANTNTWVNIHSRGYTIYGPNETQTLADGTTKTTYISGGSLYSNSSTEGIKETRLVLGNDLYVKDLANNSKRYGEIWLYDQTNKKSIIKTRETMKADTTFYLPDQGNFAYALWTDNTKIVGSENLPIYIDDKGQAQQCVDFLGTTEDYWLGVYSSNIFFRSLINETNNTYASMGINTDDQQFKVDSILPTKFNFADSIDLDLQDSDETDSAKKNKGKIVFDLEKLQFKFANDNYQNDSVVNFIDGTGIERGLLSTIAYDSSNSTNNKTDTIKSSKFYPFSVVRTHIEGEQTSILDFTMQNSSTDNIKIYQRWKYRNVDNKNGLAIESNQFKVFNDFNDGAISLQTTTGLIKLNNLGTNKLTIEDNIIDMTSLSGGMTLTANNTTDAQDGIMTLTAQTKISQTAPILECTTGEGATVNSIYQIFVNAAQPSYKSLNEDFYIGASDANSMSFIVSDGSLFVTGMTQLSLTSNDYIAIGTLSASNGGTLKSIDIYSDEIKIEGESIGLEGNVVLNSNYSYGIDDPSSAKTDATEGQIYFKILPDEE